MLTAWLEGQFEIIASTKLVDELDRALAYPKLRKRIPEDDAAALVRLIDHGSVMREDPSTPPAISRDPDDDYLIALAAENEAVLVTGDRDLLSLAPELPVFSAKQFLGWLESQ